MMVKPYAELREAIDKKDRGLREKVMSLKDAIALVKDGDTIASGGCHYSRTPMAAVWEIIRQKKKGSDLLPEHHVHGRRSAAGRRCRQTFHHELVQRGGDVGGFGRHAALHRKEAGCLRRMEPYGHWIALPGRRPRNSLHPDPGNARLGSGAPAPRSEG